MLHGIKIICIRNPNSVKKVNTEFNAFRKDFPEKLRYHSSPHAFGIFKGANIQISPIKLYNFEKDDSLKIRKKETPPSIIGFSILKNRKFLHLSLNANIIIDFIIFSLEGVSNFKVQKSDIIKSLSKEINADPILYFSQFLNIAERFLKNMENLPLNENLLSPFSKDVDDLEREFILLEILKEINYTFVTNTLNYGEENSLFSFFSIAFHMLTNNGYIYYKKGGIILVENPGRKSMIENIFFFLFKIISTVHNYGEYNSVITFLEDKRFQKILQISIPNLPLPIIMNYLRTKINQFVKKENSLSISAIMTLFLLLILFLFLIIVNPNNEEKIFVGSELVIIYNKKKILSFQNNTKKEDFLLFWDFIRESCYSYLKEKYTEEQFRKGKMIFLKKALLLTLRDKGNIGERMKEIIVEGTKESSIPEYFLYAMKYYANFFMDKAKEGKFLLENNENNFYEYTLFLDRIIINGEYEKKMGLCIRITEKLRKRDFSPNFLSEIILPFISEFSFHNPEENKK